MSAKTVSRVVNADPAVATATAERVRAAIRELGFHPNPVARSLRVGRDDAIGLLVENLADPFMAEPPIQHDSDTVLVDNEEGARQATAHLIAYGHRRIAFVGERLHLYTTRLRHQGFRGAVGGGGLQRTFGQRHRRRVTAEPTGCTFSARTTLLARTAAVSYAP